MNLRKKSYIIGAYFASAPLSLYNATISMSSTIEHGIIQERYTNLYDRSMYQVQLQVTSYSYKKHLTISVGCNYLSPPFIQDSDTQFLIYPVGPRWALCLPHESCYQGLHSTYVTVGLVGPICDLYPTFVTSIYNIALNWIRIFRDSAVLCIWAVTLWHYMCEARIYSINIYRLPKREKKVCS